MTSGLNKRILFLLLIFCCFFSSCISRHSEPVVKPYEAYQEKSEELRAKVSAGQMTVTEAEELRKEAFRKYMAGLKNDILERETKNY